MMVSKKMQATLLSYWYAAGLVIVLLKNYGRRTLEWTWREFLAIFN